MNYKHGYTGTPEHRVWIAMMQRCYNPNHPKYPSYGGRGIKVCDHWRESFTNFLEDMGKRPGDNYSLDRVDNDGSYNRNNCRWATAKEQQNNQRANRLLEFNGRVQNVTQWSVELGIPYSRLEARIRRGWSVERALSPERFRFTRWQA